MKQPVDGMQYQHKPTTIYALVDPRNNEVRYVGKTVKPQQRYAEHKCNNKPGYKQNWIKSMGCSPEMVVLEVVTEGWAEAEKWWIAYLKFLGARLTNLTIGGEGNLGWVPPEEVRRKIGEANSRRIFKPETIEKHRANGFNRRHTEAEKIKIGEANKGKKLSEETKAKLRGRVFGEETIAKMKARIITDETKAKMSESAKGRKASLATRQKMSEQRKGRKNKPETILKMSEARKQYWQKRKEQHND